MAGIVIATCSAAPSGNIRRTPESTWLQYPANGRESHPGVLPNRSRAAWDFSCADWEDTTSFAATRTAASACGACSARMKLRAGRWHARGTACRLA